MALFQRLTAEQIRETLKLTRYAPELRLQNLVFGVDNVRHDVHLSPQFRAFCERYFFQLTVKHSTARRLLDDSVPAPSPADRSEFKRQSQEILLGALSRARSQQNQELDLLANIALFKYMGWEIQRQYGVVLLQGKNKMRMYEGPKHESSSKAFEIQQAFSEYQTQKKVILRLVSTELQRAVNEVQADAVRKTREAYFGGGTGNWYPYFANPLLYAESGRDDFIHLEKYVMVGNFQRDPDRFEMIEQWLSEFFQMVDQASPEACELAEFRSRQKQMAQEMESLRHSGTVERKGGFRSLFSGSQPAAGPALSSNELSSRVAVLVDRMMEVHASITRLSQTYDTMIGEMLNVPENLEEMLGASRTELQIAELRRKGGDRGEIALLEEKAEVQRYLQDELYRTGDKLGLLPFVAASYEVGRIFGDFCPPINPQTLKQALLLPEERKKVADLVRHYKLPEGRLAALEEAAGRARTSSPRDLRVQLVKYVTDYSRHRRDTAHLNIFQGLADRINLVMDEKTERLSRVNGTLYEFLISSEQKPMEQSISGHVILKADVRDSTRVTSELMARGLNPASYFSLNFYEPLNRILPRYGAEKVFIEGDAVILSLFEHEGGGGHPVALACGLARELNQIVELYNNKGEGSGLPRLEIGVGITFRNSAPLFLFDGETRIMISEALNLSDRLSGCSKLARKSLPVNQSLFNVYIFQTITEETAAGAMEEFLVRYNVNGICLSEEAFEKLRAEISLTTLDLEMPLLWGKDKVRLHCGAVPLSVDVFQRLVIRESQVPFVEPQTFRLKDVTARRYFEVCTNRLVYEHTESLLNGK